MKKTNKNKAYYEMEINHTSDIEGQPDTAVDLVNKYGTYEIQPTNDSDNDYPKIAQGLPRSELRKKDPHHENNNFEG